MEETAFAVYRRCASLIFRIDTTTTANVATVHTIAKQSCTPPLRPRSPARNHAAIAIPSTSATSTSITTSWRCIARRRGSSAIVGRPLPAVRSVEYDPDHEIVGEPLEAVHHAR